MSDEPLILVCIEKISILLVCSLLLAVPAQAASTVEPRGSAFFSSYITDLYKTSSSSFQIWFDVVSNVHRMDELGITEIILYRSADKQTWSRMRTYTVEYHPHMIARNTTSHDGYVTYNYGTTGYYYTAYIIFYAKNSTGIGERYVYTEILQM